MNRSVVLRGQALLSSSVALAGWLMFTPAAQAETYAKASDIAAGSPLAKYLAASDYTDRLLALAKRWDRALEMQCDEPLSLEGKLGAVTIERPIDWPAGAQAPAAGTWQQRFTVKRCGKTQVYNAFVAAKADQPLHVGALVPGLSRVTSLQARDAVNAITQSVKTAEFATKGGKACLDFAVVDTQPVSGPQTQSGTHPGRFEERWTVRYCETPRPMPMCFTPLATGGTKFRAQTCLEADKTEAEEQAKAAAEAAAAASGAASGAAPAAPSSPATPATPAKPAVPVTKS